MVHASVKPLISVIIPHYNQLDVLAACVASVERQTLARDRFEILVVDNASPFGIERIRKLIGPRARLFVETDKGAGPARNRGVREAHGSIFAFIDADCVASPRWLEEGLCGLEKNDIVGGRVDVSVEDEANMTGEEAFERVFAFDFRSYIKDKGFIGSGNLFCRREAFQQVGGFRVAVSEDIDWSTRARRLGYNLGYHEAAAISHPGRANWRDLKAKWARVNREFLRLAEGQTWGRSRWMLRNWLLPLSIFPHAARVMGSPKLPDTSTRLRALVTLGKIRLWRFADSHRALFERLAR